MNANLPLCMAQALAAFAPPSSEVNQILAEAKLAERQRQQIDHDMHSDKACDGYGQRAYRVAMAIQQRGSV